MTQVRQSIRLAELIAGATVYIRSVCRMTSEGFSESPEVTWFDRLPTISCYAVATTATRLGVSEYRV